MESRLRLSSLVALVSLSLHTLRAGAVPSHREYKRQYDAKELEFDASKHDEFFFTYYSRPELEVPRWNVKVHDEKALSPGYWFMAAYGTVEQNDNDKAWVGPYIYDGAGELVWTGTPILDRFGAFDFKVSQLNGEDVLSMIHPKKGEVLMLDNTYETKRAFPVENRNPNVPDQRWTNIHEFNVETSEYMVLSRTLLDVPQEDMKKLVDYDASCLVQSNGFYISDLETGKKKWEWNPEYFVALNESYRKPDDCDSVGWDFAHLNSVDKFPDGDYLVSGRHISSLLKISAKDGSIVWRLGGKLDDFVWTDDEHFCGQHDARVMSQNETHITISIMDNAIGVRGPKGNPFSRGMVLRLDVSTTPMTVSSIGAYNHPQRGYATARGSFQVLPDGNTFVGWSDDAYHSEHQPDGKCIMEASLPLGAKSYRSFKFPWVGRPRSPPDVYSTAVVTGAITTLHVYASWNGATEVASWNLYASNRAGDNTELLASTKKTGFETQLAYEGYARFVKVDALDITGTVLGSSKVMQTVDPSDLPKHVVDSASDWMKAHAQPAVVEPAAPQTPPQAPPEIPAQLPPQAELDTQPPTIPQIPPPVELEKPAEPPVPAERPHTPPPPFKPRPKPEPPVKPKVEVDTAPPPAAPKAPAPKPPAPPSSQQQPATLTGGWRPDRTASQSAFGLVFLACMLGLFAIYVLRRVRRLGSLSLSWRPLQNYYQPLLADEVVANERGGVDAEKMHDLAEVNGGYAVKEH